MTRDAGQENERKLTDEIIEDRLEVVGFVLSSSMATLSLPPERIRWYKLGILSEARKFLQAKKEGGETNANDDKSEPR